MSLTRRGQTLWRAYNDAIEAAVGRQVLDMAHDALCLLNTPLIAFICLSNEADEPPQTSV